MSLNEITRPTVARFAEASGKRRGGRSPARLYSVALLTAGAASIHISAAVNHLPEYLPWGIFFICLAIAQVALAAVVVLVPSRSLFVAAAVGTTAVIGVWVISRTVGVPLAPVPWSPEPIGALDLTATLIEAVSIVLFVLLIRRPPRPRRRGRVRIAIATAPAALLCVLVGWLAAGTALNPMPLAVNAAPALAGQASTSVVNLVAPAESEPLKTLTLTAQVVSIGGRKAWTFNGSVPGPVLRVAKGDRLRVTLVNHLPEATSIHWHGIRVPNAEDGVAGITQDAVGPGRSYVYEFIASDAGTFWYHSHQDPYNQIPRGLFGALVVEPQASPVREGDYVLMIHTVPGEATIAVDGHPNLHLAADPNETVRLRLINAASTDNYGTPLTPALVGAPYTIASLDGHDLNQPQVLGPEQITLAMGQRADLLFKMPSSGAVRLVGLSGAAKPLAFLGKASTAAVTIGTGAAPPYVDVGRLPRFDLTSYGSPTPDSILDDGRYDLTQNIVLGTGPRFHNGEFNILDTINGRTSPFVIPIHVSEGEVVRLHIVNSDNDRMWHPIHIHGHIFSILARNGHRLSGSPVRVDTVLVGPGETWDVAFRADNPGIWMLHCHVLVHALAGMSMTINYDGISTPFTMGSRSGNVPE